MKRLVTTLAAIVVAGVVAITGFTASRQDRLSAPSTAIFTTKLDRTKREQSNTVYVYKVNDRKGRLAGNYILVCFFAGRGGVLGNGVWHCNGSFRLARGAVIVSGPIRLPNLHELAITGGTGFYAGAGGAMTSTSTKEPGRNLIVFRFLPAP
jgi:hypothetical protein